MEDQVPLRSGVRTAKPSMDRVPDPTRQALIVWAIFFTLNILLNGTIPFILGADMRAWKASALSSVLFGLVQYGIIFTLVPLILIKGWDTVRQPAFLVPLCIGLAAMSLSLIYHGSMVAGVLVLAYLHWRFDLSDYGIRSRGWKGDLAAAALLGVLYASPSLLRSNAVTLDPLGGLVAGLDRLFTNPASTVENLFYFGFIAERLSLRAGRWLTPFLIGAMYTAHEMSNPEYWYEGMNFLFVFIGVTLYTLVYLWRRGVIAIWLGDGLGRFLGRLL